LLLCLVYARCAAALSAEPDAPTPSTVAGENLDLRTGAATFGSENRGRIRLFERLQFFPEDLTISHVTVGIQTPAGRVYMMDSAASIFEMINMSAELRYTHSPIAGAGPVMASWPSTIRATKNPIALAPAFYKAIPLLIADGVPFTLTDLTPSYEDVPTLVTANGGSFAESSAWTSFRSGAVVGAGVTLGQRRALHVKDAMGKGSLLTQIGIDIDPLTKGGIANVSLRSSGAAAEMRHAGPVIIGSSTTAPEARLQVSESRLGAEVFRAETSAPNDDPNYRIFQYRQATAGNVTNAPLARYMPRDQAVTLLEARVVSRCTANCATVGSGGAGTIIGRFRRSGSALTRIGTDASPAPFAEDTDGTEAIELTATPSGAVEVRATTTGDDDIDLLWHVTVIAQDAGL
jgi:hypothetical protein